MWRQRFHLVLGMPDHFLFSHRIALLLGLMLVVSLVDFYRNGARAGKFREYGFIIMTGAVGRGRIFE